MHLKSVFAGLLVAAIAAGCAPTPQGQVAALSSQSTASLCSQHSYASGFDLLAIEAELGARGALQCQTSYGSTSYVGAKTAGTVGRASYARASATPSAVRDDKDCSDFTSAGAAQKFFLASGGPHRDPHNLDGDGDGNACEWGKTLKASAAKYKPKPVAYSAPRYSSGCYTGPRGGRYTITASGRKNYGGC